MATVLLVSVPEGRGDWADEGEARPQGSVGRAQMKNLGREAMRAVCYKLQGGIGKVVWAGSQERQDWRERKLQQQSGLAQPHSRVRISEHRDWGLSAFSGLPPEAKSFQPRGDHCTLPWGSSSSCHCPVGQTQTLIAVSPFVLGAQEPIPGIVPAGQTPSQCIPSPAGVTAHLETIMSLLSSNGCSNHWTNFPKFLFSSLCSQVSFS